MSQEEIFGRLERKTLQRAVLVHIELNDMSQQVQKNQENFQEFIELATSAGVEIVETFYRSRSKIDPKLFVGKGVSEQISAFLVGQSELENDIDVVIVNHALSPSQERNLERVFSCQVLDRVGLILDIFAQRAKTYEGKLQVELAQLKHMSTRLVRGWTHLERQKGGIGMRGPGETQLETDRRLLADRMKLLTRNIDKIKNQRDISRKSRQKNNLPMVTIVGYTNAGKSSLFNQLTQADVEEADQLFATLDATIRSVHIAGAGLVIVSDTVGFIRHIPHDLIASFRSTLEETKDADLLIHLVDASDKELITKLQDVLSVLAEIGAATIPQLLVLNKIDQLSDEELSNIQKICKQQIHALKSKDEFEEINVEEIIGISVLKEINIQNLHDSIGTFFKGGMIERHIEIDPADGKLRAQIYQLGKVLSENLNDAQQLCLHLQISESAFKNLMDNHRVCVV